MTTNETYTVLLPTGRKTFRQVGITADPAGNFCATSKCIFRRNSDGKPFAFDGVGFGRGGNLVELPLSRVL